MPPKIFFIKCKDLALYYWTIFCHMKPWHTALQKCSHYLFICWEDSLIQGGWHFSHFLLCGIFQTWGSDHGITWTKKRFKQNSGIRCVPCQWFLERAGYTSVQNITLGFQNHLLHTVEVQAKLWVCIFSQWAKNTKTRRTTIKWWEWWYVDVGADNFS